MGGLEYVLALLTDASSMQCVNYHLLHMKAWHGTALGNFHRCTYLYGFTTEYVLVT
jgi:hypothetical protein